MRAAALLAFLLLAAPAAAQEIQCMDRAEFMRVSERNGYEVIVRAKDGDGDEVNLLFNGLSAGWIFVFIPQQQPAVVCRITSGGEFKVVLGKGV